LAIDAENIMIGTNYGNFETPSNAGLFDEAFYRTAVTNATEAYNLWRYQQLLAPIILTIDYPINTNYYPEPKTMNFTYAENNATIDQCWWALNYGTNHSVNCNATANLSEDNATDGSNHLDLFANSTDGDEFSTSVDFTFAPKAVVTYPGDISYPIYHYTPITINFTVDLYPGYPLDTCLWSLDAGTTWNQFTCANNTYIDLADGSCYYGNCITADGYLYLSIFVNDTRGGSTTTDPYAAGFYFQQPVFNTNPGIFSSEYNYFTGKFVYISSLDTYLYQQGQPVYHKIPIKWHIS
jgi:hypothetical protein